MPTLGECRVSGAHLSRVFYGLSLTGPKDYDH
ncbi:uncharacterized protein METZ01_LOCUS233353 [marine metagenome]|uniref:Uncharacterized protein n=1 Tax=marine metagenome TaxID=408172 RepID=A0A382GZX3_9ZZZZ